MLTRESYSSVSLRKSLRFDVFLKTSGNFSAFTSNKSFNMQTYWIFLFGKKRSLTPLTLLCGNYVAISISLNGKAFASHTENPKNSFSYLCRSTGIFYAVNVATVSSESVNFVNEDREFHCLGKDIEWFLPNGTRVLASNGKYHLSNSSDNDSTLLIRNLGFLDVGEYKCVSDEKEESFSLRLYCESDRAP